MRDVLRVIGARLTADAEFGANQGGCELGDNFFGDVRGIAEAFAELAVEAAWGA
jgi:hypothetical protein